MVELLFEKFTKLEKEEWLKMLENDLLLSQLNKNFYQAKSQFDFSPVIHPSDRLEIYSNSNRKNNSWQIGEKFKQDLPTILNQKILKSLDNGVQSLEISIFDDYDLVFFEGTFEKVFLEYISVNFILGEHANVTKFLNLFQKFLNKNQLNSEKLIGSIYQVNTKVPPQKFAQFPGFCKTVFTLENSKVKNTQIIDLLSDINNFIAQNFEVLKKNNYKNFIKINLEIDESFYWNIARIRAIKILLYNILKGYKIKIEFLLSASINLNESDDENFTLINATSMAVSAVIGGVDFLFVNPFNSNFNRLTQNIQHILEVESKFGMVADPVRGSYFIDHFTKRICDENWSQFIQN